MECNIYSTLIIITTEITVIDSAEYTWDISNYNAMVQISLRVISCNNNKFCKYQSVEKLTTTHGFLCSPKGEAFSRRFVRLSVCLVPCPANNFKTTVGILNETWYIYRWQWGEGQNPITIILPCIFIELSPHNHFVACRAISRKVQKGLQWNLVYR